VTPFVTQKKVRFSIEDAMRADRLLSILMLLQSRGRLTAQTLADELSVSRRTILRDVEALSYSGVPIYTDGGHGGGISLDENYRTTLTGLNESEVRALFISENTQILNDIGLGDATRRMIQKLSAALPSAQQSLVQGLRQRIYIDPTWWWQETQPMPFWSELEKAVFEDHQIQVRYENYNGEVAERTLEPYSLVAKASTWYLIAKRGQQMRLYRVSRFHTIRLLETRFHREKDYDLMTFWQTHAQAFRDALAEYSFTLQVHPDRLGFIQTLVPGRFQVLSTDPASGWHRLNFQLESVDLAKMLVFGLGSQAVVLNPPELHAAVLSRARELLEAR
jgi:predicted DNA-binding transcriptional regulator YafY